MKLPTLPASLQFVADSSFDCSIRGRVGKFLCVFSAGADGSVFDKCVPGCTRLRHVQQELGGDVAEELTRWGEAWARGEERPVPQAARAVPVRTVVSSPAPAPPAEPGGVPVPPELVPDLLAILRGGAVVCPAPPRRDEPRVSTRGGGPKSSTVAHHRSMTTAARVGRTAAERRPRAESLASIRRHLFAYAVQGTFTQALARWTSTRARARKAG